MRQITTITTQARQSFTVISEEGEEIKISLRFLPTQVSWFMDVVTENFSVYNLRVSISPNILDKFHNILSFGICVLAQDGVDPFQVDDFYTGRAEFYILDKEDKDLITEGLDGKAQ